MIAVRSPWVYAVALFVMVFVLPAWAESDSVLEAMQVEIERSQQNLPRGGEFPLYFLQYTVTEERRFSLAAANGAFEAQRESFRRYLDVDVRVGQPSLDNTHEIRGGSWRDNASSSRVVAFPTEADVEGMRGVLWAETEYQFQKAQERYTKVLSNRQVKVAEEDTSPDFSPAPQQQFSEIVFPTQTDTIRWRGILARVTARFMDLDFVHDSRVSVDITDKVTYLVNSDGTRLRHGNHYLRLGMQISGMANDGMELYRYRDFSAAASAHMPEDEKVMEAAEKIAAELKSLIQAPLVEPYIGPAILRNRASGVFFHEIFGHRIEGHRQKSSTEGQTFTKKVGQEILPVFISVYDDPTMARFRETDLRGFYRFDDEGVMSQRALIVENGILRSFLLSRSPVAGFPESNGHGRREYGRKVVSRQGNLIVQSSKSVTYNRLREMLVEECRRQGKPYGLVFEDISGGFTETGREGPQAFKVIPLVVQRVYADGRPDEIVRGVDIVGTPLTCFSKILMTADDDDVFNGTCGAESGWVPVSAVSPSVLVSEIEVEKRQKEQERPPILPPPPREHRGAPGM